MGFFKKKKTIRERVTSAFEGDFEAERSTTLDEKLQITKEVVSENKGAIAAAGGLFAAFSAGRLLDAGTDYIEEGDAKTMNNGRNLGYDEDSNEYSDDSY